MGVPAAHPATSVEAAAQYLEAGFGARCLGVLMDARDKVASPRRVLPNKQRARLSAAARVLLDGLDAIRSLPSAPAEGLPTAFELMTLQHVLASDGVEEEVAERTGRDSRLYFAVEAQRQLLVVAALSGWKVRPLTALELLAAAVVCRLQTPIPAGRKDREQALVDLADAWRKRHARSMPLVKELLRIELRYWRDHEGAGGRWTRALRASLAAACRLRVVR